MLLYKVRFRYVGPSSELKIMERRRHHDDFPRFNLYINTYSIVLYNLYKIKPCNKNTSTVCSIYLVLCHHDDGLKGPLPAERQDVVLQAGLAPNKDNVAVQSRRERGRVQAKRGGDAGRNGFHLDFRMAAPHSIIALT